MLLVHVIYLKTINFIVAAAGHQCTPNCVVAGCAIPDTRRAEHAFEVTCHQEFFVYSVTPATKPRKKPCSWIVFYKYNDLNRIYHQDSQAKSEFQKIISQKPTDVSVSGKTVILSPPSYCVEYTTECTCPKPNFRHHLTQPNMGLIPVSIGIEDIKKEIINLSISWNIKIIHSKF